MSSYLYFEEGKLILGKVVVWGSRTNVTSAPIDTSESHHKIYSFHTHCSNKTTGIQPPSAEDMIYLICQNIQEEKSNIALVLTPEGIYVYSMRIQIMRKLSEKLENAPDANTWFQELRKQFSQVINKALMGKVGDIKELKKHYQTIGMKLNFIPWEV
jgi:hypothetical protein